MIKKIGALLLGGMMLFGVCGCEQLLNFAGGGDSSAQEQSSPGDKVEVVKERIFLQSKQHLLFLDDADAAAQKIAATVYDDGTVENPALTYEVSNPSVAEIAADGTIIAKGVGLTEVTVGYKKAKATAEVRVVGKTTAANVNTYAEAYVNTYGRTYVKDGKLCLDHVASGLEIAIDGESLTAEIESTANLYLCVYVDGNEEPQRILVTPSKKSYTLASGLTKGFHTVRVAKSSEIYDGQIRIVSVASEGFYTAPEKSNFKIEFIGDSITAGYGALGGIGDARTVENSDACSSYAYYTAQKLGVDYSLVAIQGICVKANMWTSVCMADVYKQLSPLNAEAYQFTSDTDVVVLNLGTNDATYITSKDFDYSEQFPNDYANLLKYIRLKNPNAYIICLYGFMGKQSSVDRGIAQAVADFNDSKTVYLNSSFIQNGLGANGHPTQEAQSGWAEILADYIQTNIMKR